MLHDFQYNWQQLQVPETATLLVAVSGGIDSVVLCHLLHLANRHFSIAHCNFGLRGSESQRDEAFVRQLAAQLKVPLFVERFDTTAYAATHKLSTQVAARELRYNWFNTLTDAQDVPFRYILTAHHADDNAETVLFNIFRGTGLSGLHGIQPRHNNLLRPLLFASREQITAYAHTHGLQWVEDSSNASEKYTRNFIRHRVVPVIREAFPHFSASMQQNIARWQEAEMIYTGAIRRLQEKLCIVKGNEVHIPVLKLQQQTSLNTLVYELARPYGFSAAQAPEIIKLLSAATGSYLVSPTHRILRNRGWLIISPLEHAAATHILVEADIENVPFNGGTLQFQQQTATASRITTEATHAFIDQKEVTFPLILRPWKQGDYFYPLGMRKKKKISRFLIDRKLSALQKEKIWVLESNKRILWVVGHRIDDRFKVTEKTSHVLHIRFVPAG